MHRSEIPIASPCAIDWNGMTLADAKKRFCGECRKHVHDLSQLTRPEARALLASPTTEGLCVRYLHDERGEIWFAPEAAPLVAPGRLARVKRAAAALAAPLSLTACMGTAMPPEPRLPPPALTATMGAPIAPPTSAEPATPPPPATAPKVAAPR